MAKAIAGIIAILLTMGSFGPVLAGDWTTHGFLYKPSPGARGTVEKGRYDSGQDRVDARLNKEIWVGDPNYGTTLQNAISAIGSTNVLLHIPAGTHNITVNLTIPGNISLKPERGALLSVATATTLTINGSLRAGLYQIFSLAGTGKVVFARPHRTEEINPIWWGAKGDGVADDVIPLQQTVDCSLDSNSIDIYVPSGTYKLTNTLKLGYGDGRWASFTFRGENTKDGVGTVFDATAFNDRPAINLQGAYKIKLKNFYVFGGNIIAPAQSYPNFKPLVTDWIDAGLSNYRYAPYAGITVSAYRGAAPDGSPGNEAYPNDTYNRQYCGYIVMERVWVRGFVAGICVAPGTVDDQNDMISMYDITIDRCAYGFSCGGSQARSIQMYNPIITNCWVALTNDRHGLKDGNMPSIHGGLIQQGWKLLEKKDTSNPCVISGLHTENLVWIGENGTYDSSSQPPTVFSGCRLGRATGNNYQSPFYLIALNPVVFNGCSFIPHQNSVPYARVWNFITGGSSITSFNGCGFDNMSSTVGTFIGLTNGSPFSYGTVRDIVAGTSNFPKQSINLFYNALPSKEYVQLGVQNVYIYNSRYKVSGLNRYGYASAAVSGVSLGGTAKGATLTFTATNPYDFNVGDIIFWRAVNSVAGVTQIVPALVIATINYGTGAANATVLSDGIDATYAPSSLYIATPFFFNGVESTGSTHSNTTLDNVTTAANWSIGDWIQGTGIPADTRITNIVGTTLTLSRPATASAGGVPLYNCRLVAY